MDLYEYQARQMFKEHGVPVLDYRLASTPEEAREGARELLAEGASLLVVKAQVKTGGRGKAGGVKLAHTADEAYEKAEAILGLDIKGHIVKKVMIASGADIAAEYYFSILLDRSNRRHLAMCSREGGMDIEEVAAKTPEKIHKVFCDVAQGLTDAEADDLATRIGIPAASLPKARQVLQGLYKAFFETDASLAEINPLILTGSGDVIALDAKLNFDSNALFRHADIVEMRDLDEEDPAEVEASKFDLAYIQLDGNIGCLVNGAGLAMATMDTIKLFGGSPANFLDVGGGATAEKVTEAFKLMLKNKGVKAILVNIFGGIMRCDTIAAGVIAASKAVNLSVPLVVRMKGTNEELGKQMLADSGLPIIAADTMADAARQVVAAAAGK